jgi:hypothetical protein
VFREIVGKQEVIWSVKACCIKVSGNQIIGTLPASTLSLEKLPKTTSRELSVSAGEPTVRRL